MKKISFLITMLLLALSASATVTFSGKDLKIKPGETAQLEISMTNDVEFAGFQLDVVLPEGITVQGKTKKQQAQLCGILEELEFDYTVGTTSDGNYGIRVYSTDGLTIDPSEGTIITVNVKADESMDVGDKEIKLINIILSQDGQPVDLESVTFKANLYQEYPFSVASANETMGSVTGENGTYESGTSISVTATANEGYHFVNWTSGETVASTETSYTFTLSSDVIIVANFAPNQYIMTFVLDNGEENVVKTQDYTSDLTAPEGLTKTGYTFAGWNPEVPPTVPAEDETFTAQWTINQYAITFKLGNGEDDVVMTQDYNTALEAPTPEREGYTFTGWDTDVPGTVPAGDMTFTAQWQINQYSVTFLADGTEVYSQMQDYGSEIVAPDAPAKKGYTFTGWTPEVAETVPAHDVSYTAVYAINQYVMTFVLGNGEDDVVKTQDYGTALEAPTPEREGYTFTGWDTDVPGTVPAGDMTLTAQWQINQYSVTFLADGTEVYSQMQDYGSEIMAPDTPAKEGYTFTGWTPEVAETVPAHDVSYTAVYTINQYTVTFIIDGEVIFEQEQDYGSAIIIPDVPEREGYTFSGWGDVAETVPAEDVTYTGTYILNPIDITFLLHKSGIGTLMLPFDSEVPEGLQVYMAVDVVDNVITLEQQDIIEAGVPLIVIGEMGEYMFTGVPTLVETQASAGILTGTTEGTVIGDGYVLQTQNDVTGFYHVDATSPISVPAFHCWLNYNGTAGVIEFKDLPNSILDIDTHKDTTTVYYDLLGRKLGKVHTGIYIINNKKMLIRQ